MKYEVRCTECGSNVKKDSREEAQSVVDSHNESRHDGEDVAEVVGEHDPLIRFSLLLEDVHKKQGIHSSRRNSDYLRALCPECEYMNWSTDESEAWQMARTHNEIEHGGEDIAGIITEDLNREELSVSEKYPIDGPDAVEILADISRDAEVVVESDL